MEQPVTVIRALLDRSLHECVKVSSPATSDMLNQAHTVPSESSTAPAKNHNFAFQDITDALCGASDELGVVRASVCLRLLSLLDGWNGSADSHFRGELQRSYV